MSEYKELLYHGETKFGRKDGDTTWLLGGGGLTPVPTADCEFAGDRPVPTFKELHLAHERGELPYQSEPHKLFEGAATPTEGESLPTKAKTKKAASKS
jgi:hypothetical protein